MNIVRMYVVVGAILFSLVFAATAYAADPVAHWKFDEGEGTTATDSSGNNHTGTISGATYSAFTPPDVAFEDPFSLEFDGVDDGVSTPLSLNNYAEFTLAGWAYPRSADGSEGWFGANDVFEFIFDDATTLRCWTSAGAVNWSFADDEDFLNNWHHITCLGDGENVILYVDGDEVARTAHEPVVSYGTGDNFTIGLGVQNGDASGPFDGYIDDVRVYSEALTPAEMFSLGTGSDEPTNSPVVSALSPANGDGGVSIDPDFSITFNMDVAWGTGNLLIRAMEDDAIIETILVTGDAVSGSGTETLSFSLSDVLDHETEYYIEIPDTAVADVVDDLAFAGITGTTTWNFTTREAVVPTVYTNIATSTTATDVELRGDITDAGSDYVMGQGFQYGETSSYGSVIESPHDGPFDIGEYMLSLGGLRCGTTYHFRAFAESAAGMGYGDDGTFETSACSSSGRRSGGSIQSRVKNLTEMGNTAAASALMAQYAPLFGASSVSLSMSSSVPVRDLEISLEGEDVRMLQELLIARDTNTHAKALAGIGATGYFGAYTQRALAEYQSANGVAPAAGYFGPLTRAQMSVIGLAGRWW